MADGGRRGSGWWGRLTRAVRPAPQATPAKAKQARPAADSDDEKFDTPEKAYAEAERRIAEARRTGAIELDLQIPSLSQLPPSLAGLTALQRLGLDRTRVTDLAPLAGLTALQRLGLDRTRVTDLAPLAGLKALKTLGLEGTRVTDLAPLAELTALQALWLNSTKVTDLAPLAGLTALQHLWLDGTGVTDLAPLAGLTALQGLWLDGTRVTDLAPLAGLTALQNLGLTDTGVTDLAPLAGLTALQHLGLGGTGVTDLAPLAGLTALQTLLLNSTKVTDLAPLAGLTALQMLRLDETRVTDLAPLAGLTALADAVQRDEPFARFLGIQYDGAAVTARPPFDTLVKLPQPARTVETLNYLRRQQGLPPHIPEGYQPPDGFEPPQPPPPPREPTLPEPGRATRFAARAGGPIDIDRGTPLPPEEHRRLAGLQAEMLEAARELVALAQRSNGYTSITASLDRYAQVLDRPVGELTDGDIEVLYARSLRVQAAHDTLQREIEKDIAPPEDVRLRAPMQVLLSLNGPFLQSTGRGLELYEQTDRDRRRRDEELAFKERQLALVAPLANEAGETTTDAARLEVAESTAMIATEPHPERTSIAGRNAVRNYYIALAHVARRWVRSVAGSPRRAAITTGKLVTGGAATAIAGKAITGSQTGAAAIAVGSKAVDAAAAAISAGASAAVTGGAAALDAALGTGGQVGMLAADFMVRHAGELRELAKAGGASFDWLATFLDWLEERVREIKGRRERE
jgi:hypothetical protein